MKKDSKEDLSLEDLKTKLTDKEWRMSNLYYIINKEGKKVLFTPNETQKVLLGYIASHPRNVILKSRQLGVSTWAVINMLDECLWKQNFTSYLLAQTMDDAKKLLATKAHFPYENLPKLIKDLIPFKTEAKEMLKWANGSEFIVDTSVRSATATALHVSELGKLSKIAPEKAREVKSGAFNAIAAGLQITIESTAEGVTGEFYDICTEAMRMKLSGEELTSLDFQFVFLPWFIDIGNSLTEEDTAKVKIPELYNEYFKSIEDYWKTLDSKIYSFLPFKECQKAWYYKKVKEQGRELMFQEQPSTPEEAFNQSIEGAYYEDQFNKLDDVEVKTCGIASVPYQTGNVVHTVWDLGYADDMAIIFYTRVGREVHIINAYSNSGEGFQHYANVLKDYEKQYGYSYGTHFAPHDIALHELSTGKSRQELARGYGINFTPIPKLLISEGIDAVRSILSTCWFDKDKCATDNPNHRSKGSGKYSLVSCLRLYRKEYDEKHGCFKDKPLHDFTSHYADAMRYLATSLDMQSLMGAGRRKAMKITNRRFII